MNQVLQFLGRPLLVTPVMIVTPAVIILIVAVWMIAAKKG